MEIPIVMFEKWATSKGLDLKRKPVEHGVVYEHPITQAAWEGYWQASRDGQRFWQPKLTEAMMLLHKHGLLKEALGKISKSE